MSRRGRGRLSSKELEERARVATKDALRDYPIADDLRKKLVLSVGMEKDHLWAALYVPGPRPEDAKFIARTRVDATTGDAQVEVLIKGPTR